MVPAERGLLSMRNFVSTVLLKPDSKDGLRHDRTLDGSGCSPLDQIHGSNVPRPGVGIGRGRLQAAEPESEARLGSNLPVVFALPD